MELNGKAPLADASVTWADSSTPERHRAKHRRRRRSRASSEARARIRRNVWLACIGALLVMAVGIHFALG